MTQFVSEVENKLQARLRVLAWVDGLLIVALILAQFLMAGLSLFKNSAIWHCHIIAGYVIALPIGALLILSWTLRLRTVRWPLCLLVLTYALQVILIVATEHGGGALWQALHPFNGSLMLVSSLAVLAKVAVKNAYPMSEKTKTIGE